MLVFRPTLFCIFTLFLCLTQSCKDSKSSVQKAQKNDSADVIDNKDINEPNSPDDGDGANNDSNSEPGTGTGSSGNGSSSKSSSRSTSNFKAAFAQPNGQCGNGEQEVYERSTRECIYDLYGTAITYYDVGATPPLGNTGLYFFDKNTGVGFYIATISDGGSGVHDVMAIDFSPNGVLYGVGIQSSNSKSALMTIDCRTGLASIVGETGVEMIGTGAITDIDFDSQGRLYAMFDNYSGADTLGIINPETGEFFAVGATGTSESGNGIASAPFPNDTLFLAGNTNLSSLNKGTGAASMISALSFPPFLDEYPQIDAMDNDNFSDITYVAIRNASPPLNSSANNSSAALDENYVGVIDRTSGEVSFLALGPQPAPSGLVGIAVNQRYEECDVLYAKSISEKALDEDPDKLNDVPMLPLGTSCTEGCLFVESDCADGIDNDGDGAIDCEDSDCENQSCDDGAACTLNDTCSSSVCLGQQNPCIDENPCTIDGICLEPSGLCDYSQLEEKPNFGDCEVDENLCTLGKCVDDEGIYCFEQNSALIPVNEGGCKDSNPCTADSCIENSSSYVPTDEFTVMTHPYQNKEAICIYESLAGSVCQPENDICSIGVCTMTGLGTPMSPYDVQCSNTQPFFPCGQINESGVEVCTENCVSTEENF
ncbi:MAG: hypothetical protein H6731_02705 [Myxococcales bacterium]|nr:MAG: hypothetical protein H6731_02705 [Myxococcales bacterium]